VERIAYGPGPAQFGELTRAEAAGSGRAAGTGVAVLIHGGFWRARYDRTLMQPLARDLARAGWTAWNLEFRRLGDGGGYPATFEDVAAGIGALAGIEGVDTGRVVAIGHSSGGQLAAWAATRRDAAVAVTGVVSQAGVLDLALAYRLGLSERVVGDLLGGGPKDVPDRYRATSPRARLPLGVPTLLVHGAGDDVVPPRMSQEFAEAADDAGDDVVLHVEPAESHMGHLGPANPMWRAVRAWL
jgi:acetyl esterase/lipase